ncbi:DUF2946 family protein [Variovorax boronicumulans]|uniref:DUF2946 family protein n=1 Tax=Variovorax boronicumulans TaxID=436515 RepID=UPI0033929D6C
MRTLLLALMIALLPIRGWLGDAMAVEMVRHSMPAASASVAADAHCHEAMDAADHGTDTMAHHDDGSSSNDHGADHQDCGTCTACQVCHTVALGGTPLVDIAHSAPQAPPAARAARFASAEPVPGLKPPIS